MTLVSGSRLGGYEIATLLGAGGMGEVFRARDTRLNRDVAIKVLPAGFAEDRERVARFRREAQLVASLNHPNVAAIYGLEEANGHVALALELVDGEDLAQRLARGPIPVDEATAIARQIAEGLEAAHEKGIVHRDLKPANVKLTKDGVVKILDFGLAKAWEAEPGSQDSGLSQSPTMSRHMTEAGMILGTAAYMSPEQARGRAVDKRADIWSFGVVLFEMLTGTRLFAGETVSDTLAAVLRQDVDLGSLPPDAPAPIRRLLARCLERDPKLRLRDIGEARIALAAPAREVAAAPRVAGRGRAAVLPWTLFAAAAGAIALLLATRAPRATTAAVPALKLRAALGAGPARFAGVQGFRALAVSPDSTLLAFVARTAERDARAHIFVRRLDQLDAAQLPGTEGAYQVFFSPDGRWVGFFSGTSLKKVPVEGGAVVTLCDAPNARGGSWGDDGFIVFSPAVGGFGLKRIAAAGGAIEDAVTLPPGLLTQRWPHALPGGRGVLYTEHRDITDFDEASILVKPPNGPPKVLVKGAYDARWVPDGHLVWVQNGRLVAAAFDLARLKTTGPPAVVLEGFAADTNTGAAQLAVARNGTLVYMPGAVASQARPIDWLARDGTVSTLRAAPSAWANPRFSPDGKRLAFDASDGRQRDIYVYEWAADRLLQLTFDPSDERAPVWSPDGARITFASDRGSPGAGNLYTIRADGTGGLVRLTESRADQRPGGWDPTGRVLVYAETADTRNVSVMTLQPPNAPETIARIDLNTQTAGTRRVASPSPEFSPDGRWIAYRGESGVFVRAAHGPGQWKVPVEGSDAMGGTGLYPRWSRSSAELLIASGNQILAAPYTVSGDEFRVRAATPWSPARYQLFGLRDAPYDLHPDGTRLAAVAAQTAEEGADQFVLVSRFADELKRLAPEATR